MTDAASFWTEERVALLRRHFERGLSVSQSAAALGTTRSAVISKRHRIGLALGPEETSRRRGWARSPRPVAEGCAVGRFSTAEETALARQHFRDGLTGPQSAAILERTPNQVINKRIRMGLLRGRNTWARSMRFKPDAGLPEIVTAAELRDGGEPLADLPPRGCRWPIEPAMAEPTYRTLFCGLPSINDPRGKGRCYCAEHFARAYPRNPAPTAAALETPYREAA